MKTTLAAAAAWLICCTLPAHGASLILNNVDPPGVGFNDPTPAKPVGGNKGRTLGQQRLIAYKRALKLWGYTLSSPVRIVVQGSFDRLDCDADGGTLAAAGTLQIFANSPNAPLFDHWYHSALANALAGFDLTPGPPDPGLLAEPFNDDILAFFNGAVGEPDCIAGPGWYYGLDSKPGPGQIDFLDTFMHEVAHGLGVSNFADVETGETILGLPDVYMANTLDLDLQAHWNVLTPEEIAASAVNNGRVVWSGARVSANAGEVLGPFEGVRLTGNIVQEIDFGPAEFGTAASSANLVGDIVAADDGIATADGGTTSDGCEPFTTAVAGKVALVDRGFCAFVDKAANAQAAGASALIIANTLGRPLFTPGGSDPALTIPTIGISNADGDAIKASLPGVGVEYFVDPTRLAGISEGYVRLYAPPAIAPGSTLSHFDTVASPNLLMEPFITESLTANRYLDLTPALLQDLGWQLRKLRIGTCNTGVDSTLPNGNELYVEIERCVYNADGNQKKFKACAGGIARKAKRAGYITDRQSAKFLACAAAFRP